MTAARDSSTCLSHRQKLCSIEHANRIATRLAETLDADIVVVRTGDPVQPFRVVLERFARGRDIVSRVVTCGAKPQPR